MSRTEINLLNDCCLLPGLTICYCQAQLLFLLSLPTVEYEQKGCLPLRSRLKLSPENVSLIYIVPYNLLSMGIQFVLCL